MSRILEALKQIEARKPPADEAAKPPSPAKIVPRGSRRPLLEPPEGPPAAETATQQPPPEEKPQDETPAEKTPSAETFNDEPQPEAAPPEEQTPADETPRDEVPPDEPPSEHALEDEIRDLLDGPVEGHDPGFRELAANILAGLPPGRPAVLLFTSPGDGEGKTTTLAPLAALLAERTSGGILAVDCNLGRPQLADQFGVAARLGLQAVLGGAAPWQEAVRSTALEGLRVLPALPPGPGEDEPVDLSALGPLLDELRHHYRLVLLDAASLAHPELASLVRVCDGTCLVVRLGQTTHRQAEAAVRAIHDSGGRLLGCVVTDVPPEQ